METSIEDTMHGDSFRGYNFWRHMLMLQCMETHIEVAKYGDSYRV